MQRHVHMRSLEFVPSCKGVLINRARRKRSQLVLKSQAPEVNKQQNAVTERSRSAEQTESSLRVTRQQLLQEADAAHPAQTSQSDISDHLISYGDKETAQQEQQLLTALQDAQRAPKPPAEQVAKPAAAKPHPMQVSSGKAVSKADMLAKISQAKAYKEEKIAKPEKLPEIIPAQPAASAQQAPQLQHADSQPKDAFSASQRQAAAEDRHEEAASDREVRALGEGQGSAAQAAGYLQQAVQAKDASKGMSMEAYSALKEQEKRRQKVEIISVDRSYSNKTKVMDPNYNPKVATWGVFERPANISEAYGGGRTIQAGTPLEDAAATQARKERMAAALARFKRDAGTQVDPAVQQACEEAFQEGEQRFQNKKLAAALSKYAAAAELMPIKTELGGRARLQQAICLDSLGQNKEAYAVYSLLERHPNAAVSKQAKRMIFGFRAMDNLKAHTMSYSVTKGAYDKYFNALSGDWDASYVSTDEDTTELNKVIAIAAAVMLAPLAFLAWKILL